MATFIKLTGFILSLLPYQVLEKVTHLLGNLLILIPNKRKRIILSNLRYAFPKWDHERILVTGRISAARMFELGFFSLTYPFFSNDQKKRVLLIDHHAELKLKELKKQNKPVVILVPHVCLFEALAVSPFFRPRNGKRFGAIYRPNRNPSIDSWIKESREAINIDVFSRDSALWKSKDYLKQGNWLALLFDQHSGIQGCHIDFLNRFASITTMPDLFAKTSRADVVFAFPHRLGFFKAGLELTHISQSSVPTSYKAHKILEQEIRKSAGLPEWLWSHERWKTQQNPRFHLMHRHKREFFPEPIPRTTKIWIRMPNWLGDVVMALPLIEAIFKSRPDAKITLLAKPQFEGLFSFLDLGYEFISIPSWSSISEIRGFLSKRREYPSMFINFANSFRSDIESFLIGAPARYGLTFSGRCRPLLSHSFNPSNDLFGTDTNVHQTELWREMLEYFGLAERPTFNAFSNHSLEKDNKIGIFPGSSNSPQKRWPVANWCSLIKQILGLESCLNLIIYGSKADSEIANSIEDIVNHSRVINRCGVTDLKQLASELTTCSMVIGNDSGGMHLANCLGLPTVVVFGPTNPNATKPIYGENSTVIQTDFDSHSEGIGKIISQVSAIIG